MKTRKILLPAAPVLALSLSHCVVVEDDGTAFADQPVSDLSPGSNASQVIYIKGYRMGFGDGRNGLARNLQRYEGDYPAEQSDNFSIGYEEGYVRGKSRPAHAKPGSQSPPLSAAGMSQPGSARDPARNRAPEASPVLNRPAGPRLPIFRPMPSP